MLEALDLSRSLSKARYKQLMPRLQSRLHRLQRACWEGKVATVVVFEGWEAAGKGGAIRKLTRRLEPRRFSLHAIRDPRTLESQLPWMFRFWVALPNWGEMAIFDRSWYRRVLAERVEGGLKKRQWREAYRDIVSFERSLVDDRYVLVKFLLHISRKTQKKRFRKLESDPATRWRVDATDWRRHKQYGRYLVAVEEMLARTESEWGPWTLVEATDRRWARVKILETLIGRMQEGLERHGCPVPESTAPPAGQDEDD